MRKNFTDILVGRPNTIKTQKSLFNKHLKDRVDNPLLLHTSSTDRLAQAAEEFVQQWLEEELSPGTIKQLISLYRRWARWTMGYDIDLSSLSRKIGRLRAPEEVRAWSLDEAKRALEHAKIYDKSLYRMMLFTLHTGVRKGEMFGIRWGDIDLLNSRINVKRSYDGPTKNGKPRSIPMSDKVEELLQNGYIVGAESDHLFPETNVNYRLKKICKYANIKELTWHGLRHTFATLALQAGRSPKAVQMILGHSHLSETLNKYWSMTGEDMDLGFTP